MNTSILFQVQDDVQLIAESIKSVLNIEVIIYDENKVVVAATGGGTHTKIGDKVRGFIVGEVMNFSEPIYNFQPGFHNLCRPCSLWGKCPEKMDVSFPLSYEGKTIGVISLTAFTDEQKEEFEQRYVTLSNYLGKMADLISNKISAKAILEKYISLAQMLEVTIQSMYEGVLAVDKEGRIIELNRSGEQILGVSKQQVYHQKFHDVLPGFPMEEVLLKGIGKNEEEYSSVVRGKKVQLMASPTPLIHEGKIVGAVTSFKDLNMVHEYIYSFTSENDASDLHCIIGESKAITEAKMKAKRIANSNSTVIILGESGTGKELFARSIHTESMRRDKPFRAINCAAIPEHLLESELFGYTEGAFTGAIKKGRPGKFEMANGGTIFLDEIGDMPLHLQVKILRVLQERRIERIGGNEPVPIDVRIIAATNKNLELMVAKGEFREDLFYRLSVIPLHTPPLRDRKEDIPILIHHFMDHYIHITNKPIRGFSKEAEEILYRYAWPGNVRELQNAVEYSVYMATGHWIQVQEIPERIRNGQSVQDEPYGVVSLEEMERQMIRKAMQQFGLTVEGKKKAAQALGINLATLYRKLSKWESELKDLSP